VTRLSVGILITIVAVPFIIVAFIVHSLVKLVRPECSLLVFQSSRQKIPFEQFKAAVQTLAPEAIVTAVGEMYQAKIGPIQIKVGSEAGIMTGANAYRVYDEQAKYAVATHLGWIKIIASAPKSDLETARALAAELAAALIDSSSKAIWSSDSQIVFALDDRLVEQLRSGAQPLAK